MLNYFQLQEYTGPDMIHDEQKPVILLTKPEAKTTVKKCQGKVTVFFLVTITN